MGREGESGEDERGDGERGGEGRGGEGERRGERGRERDI